MSNSSNNMHVRQELERISYISVRICLMVNMVSARRRDFDDDSDTDEEDDDF